MAVSWRGDGTVDWRTDGPGKGAAPPLRCSPSVHGNIGIDQTQ